MESKIFPTFISQLKILIYASQLISKEINLSFTSFNLWRLTFKEYMAIFNGQHTMRGFFPKLINGEWKHIPKIVQGSLMQGM